MFEALRFARQGPGLFRKAMRDCMIAERTHHETELRRGTTVFAATQSAMHDDDVVDDPGDFRTDRPHQWRNPDTRCAARAVWMAFRTR